MSSNQLILGALIIFLRRLMVSIINKHKFMLDPIYHVTLKELRVLRGYFGPPMKSKNKNSFSPNSLISLFEKIAKV